MELIFDLISVLAKQRGLVRREIRRYIERERSIDDNFKILQEISERLRGAICAAYKLARNDDPIGGLVVHGVDGDRLYWVGCACDNAAVGLMSFYIKEDVLDMNDGRYDVFVYPAKADEIPGTKKIPAILYIGDYGYLEGHDIKNYRLDIYPHCCFTSATGVIWNELKGQLNGCDGQDHVAGRQDQSKEYD